MPVIIVCASGGARMYEGMLSLMQMAKTSGALALSRPGEAALHHRAHESHDRRRDGEFRLARRRDPRGAEEHDRICRSARDQGNDASGFAGRIPDGGISREARPGRSHCAPREVCAACWPNCSATSSAGKKVTCPEALAWLYSTQQFGIKLGLENTRRLLAAARQSRASRSRSFTSRARMARAPSARCSTPSCAPPAIAPGLYTSPHLVDFRERIRVDGEKLRRRRWPKA